MIKVVSFFSGCGGLDLGFRQAGFDVIWANEYDSKIHPTYRLNHPNTYLCTKDIRDIDVDEIPSCDGFIGGPPCQSWSVGGNGKGIEDDRGKLFLTYINLIKSKKPPFFVIENVFGILLDKHIPEFLNFIKILEETEYNVYYTTLNAADFGVPQDRKRIFIVGFDKKFNINFKFPEPYSKFISLKDAIGDLHNTSPLFYKSHENVAINTLIPNHDCYVGIFDRKFMARNRVRSWSEKSFTIQAQAKNCPIHPQAPKMVYLPQRKQCISRILQKRESVN